MNSKSEKRPGGEPFDRIMDVATDLFFKQGYRATGINQIIEESGVAKATFYSHFKSKDELCRHYLEHLKSGELQNMSSAVNSASTARERYLAPMQTLGPWLDETRFRGCPFVNIASEVPDPASPLRRVGMEAYKEISQCIEEVCRELVASDEKYSHVDPESLAQDYLLIFVGAVSLAELYHDSWPAQQAIAAVARLIDQ